MKKSFIVLAIVLIVCVSIAFVSCTDEKWTNTKGYDLSLFDFATAGKGAENANDAGWYEVFTDNFDYTSVADMEKSGIWTTSPHVLRWGTQNNKEYENSYWCPEMVSFKDGMVEIKSEQRTNHVCSSGKCPSVGRFTGGIETRRVVGASDKGDSDELLFSQAFGYFETRVKFPKADGLWSAFWLQSSNQRKVASEGVDGTEIDIYESAFIKNPTKMGNALLWNGYWSKDNQDAKVDGIIYDTKKDLYDGFHTFALKWTPEYYVFYIDDEPMWASNGGGVAKVKEFLRLTVEIDAGDGYGPHGQKIGKFKAGISPIFYVDYVKVYQNVNYSQYEIPDSMFPGELNKDN